MTVRQGSDGAKARILVVDDEVDHSAMIGFNLERQGYNITMAEDGEDAIDKARDELPDLILLDWMLPGRSGLGVCRALRRERSTRQIPIIMLTARGEEADRVRGLENGADDYLIKPFSMAELSARINAVLRRVGSARDEEVLEVGDIVMDQPAHKVRRGDRPVKLGPTEYRLLQHLMHSPGRVFSREHLLDAVWGRDVYVEIRTVDVHIRRLRKALNEAGEPDPIRTVRSAGYALDNIAS